MDAPIVSTHMDYQHVCVGEWHDPSCIKVTDVENAISIVLKLFLHFNDLCVFETVKFNPEVEKLFF